MTDLQVAGCKYGTPQVADFGWWRVVESWVCACTAVLGLGGKGFGVGMVAGRVAICVIHRVAFQRVREGAAKPIVYF